MNASRLGKLLLFASILASLPLAAQAPQVYSSKLGFSFTLPEDWEVVVPKPVQPAQQPKPPANASPEEKQGMACLEVPITARHGDPASVVVIDALPFDCLRETMAGQDLAAFGSGVTEGLKTTLDFLNPVNTTYALAGHVFWIERVKAVPKGKTAPVTTVEITCTILTGGAVCWMVQAADEPGLQAFENAVITLEGSPLNRLVPRQVFARPPVPPKNAK